MRIESLSSRPSVDHETLLRAMRELVDRISGALEGEAVLDDCVDVLVELLGADRGLVVITRPDGTTSATHGRRLGSDLAAVEREEISRTLVREALDTGRCVVYRPEPAASTSVTSPGIVAALAVTLHDGPRRVGPDRRRAVLYVDLRDPRKFLHASHIDFFMTSALLVGAVLEEHRKAETKKRLPPAARRVPSSRPPRGIDSRPSARGSTDRRRTSSAMFSREMAPSSLTPRASSASRARRSRAASTRSG